MVGFFIEVLLVLSGNVRLVYLFAGMVGAFLGTAVEEVLQSQFVDGTAFPRLHEITVDYVKRDVIDEKLGVLMYVGDIHQSVDALL